MASTTARGHVLVVDDDALFSESVSGNLVEAGYRTRIFSDGPATLHHLACEPDADLVLLDWKMPGMTGSDTLLQLRRIAPGLKAIVSSGLPREEAEHHFRDVEISGYLQKPYRMSELTSLVEASLTA